MHTVNLKPTDTELSRLVDLTRAGEEVVIAESGQPVAKLVPIVATTSEIPVKSGERRFGLLRGQVQMGPEFDDPLPEEMMRAFRGEAE